MKNKSIKKFIDNNFPFILISELFIWFGLGISYRQHLILVVVAGSITTIWLINLLIWSLESN